MSLNDEFVSLAFHSFPVLISLSLMLNLPVANVWYSIEVRPYTDPSSAYNSWSVAWPVLAVTGPVLAAVFFGGTVVSAAGTVAASAASLSASAASLAAKASRIPGGSKLKARLVEAAKKNLVQGQKVVQERVVRYFMEATAVEAAVAESERMRKRREENQRKLKERKLVEVDVTGLELEKVLRCQTGKRKVDKVSFVVPPFLGRRLMR